MSDEWNHPCGTCGHARSTHRKADFKGPACGVGTTHVPVGEGIEPCKCMVYSVDGVAYAIQSGTRWIAFNETKTIALGKPYPCTNMGVAKFFDHQDVAKAAVEEHGPKCVDCMGDGREETIIGGSPPEREVGPCPKCHGRGTPWIVRELLPTPTECDTING